MIPPRVLTRFGTSPKIEKELEIFVRAEKSMIMSAPGFPAAWEMAKANAADEIAGELAGKSVSKRIFRKIFGKGASTQGVEQLNAAQKQHDKGGIRHNA